MALSQRMRFEILRRDSYTCRYCGHRAPEVELVVDHVVPVALGGTDVPENLVAACTGCNAGKTSVGIDDTFVAEINDKALRWRQAMAAAAELRQRHTVTLDAECEPVRTKWLEYYVAADEDKPDADRRRIHLPNDWRTGVRHFLAAGLPIEDMVSIVDVAMRGSLQARVPDARWRYYMGCCKGSLRELEQRAQALIAAQEAAAAPAHPSTEAARFAEPTLDDLP